MMSPQPVSQKSFLAVWVLSLLVGGFGVDRFYLGKIGTGIVKLVTLGGFGIWWLIDLILILAGAMRDKQGLPLERPAKPLVPILITIAVCAISSVSGNIVGSNLMNGINF